MLANCGTDTGKARQALTRYIARKQEKGRSTEHILKKLRQLEVKFINDTTLHAAFRDARATTCLPRSQDVPLPDFVIRETAARTSRQSVSALRDIATPSPSPSTPKSWSYQSYSSVKHVDPIVQEDRIQSEMVSYKPYEASLPPTNAPGRLPIQSPYAFQIGSSRSRSSTLQSLSIPSPSTRSPKKIRTSFNSPPPTSPLPDLPSDKANDYELHIPRCYLPSPANSRPSSGSKSSSSSHSSYQSPLTPEFVPPRYRGSSSQSTAITRGNTSYPPRKEEKLPQQPLIVVQHYPSDMDIPSMFLPSREGSLNASENSAGDFPIPYRDSPILRERSASRNPNFSFPLDNALQRCAVSPVVRREVARCLEQEQGYERYNWPIVLQECDIAEDDIPLILNEMAREVGFTVSRA